MLKFEFDEATANQIVAGTIVDELHRCGVCFVTISPGSRSSALALAFFEHPGIESHVILDERSAGFFALGLAKAHGSPVAILTTSGTATAELTPAVTEASLSAVPLILITADRPMELYRSGSPQTIDQSVLYSGSLRDRRLIDAGAPGSWSRLRSVVAKSVLQAMGLCSTKGPVHLNVSFREPLISDGASLPEPLLPRSKDAPWYTAIDLCDNSTAFAFAQTLVGTRRGLIVVGDSQNHEAVFAISELLGWPTLVDPRSGLARRSRYAISYQDSFLRVGELVESLVPELVLYFGRPQASRVLSEFISHIGDPSGKMPAKIYRANDNGSDPEGVATGFLTGPLERLVGALSEAEMTNEVAISKAFVARYLRFDHFCDIEVRAAEREGNLGIEISAARAISSNLEARDLLFASASMPMRDLEFFSGVTAGSARVLQNRGANGIDGVLSSFVGAAVAHERDSYDSVSVLFVGDLAFLYDASFLGQLKKFSLAVLIVVIDNNGGGIFSFLPQKSSTAPEAFEELFSTPPDTKIADLVSAYGISCKAETKAAEIPALIAQVRLTRRPRVAIVGSDREVNLVAHKGLNQRIANALLAHDDQET